MGYMLETRGLTKRFGRGDQAQDAVADVSLHIREGEVYGLLGPNGAGKSTTLKMICGMLRPTAGEILFAGHAWRREDLYAIGSLIEEAPLYPNLTARENLRVRTTLLGLPESRVDEVLAAVQAGFLVELLIQNADVPGVRVQQNVHTRTGFVQSINGFVGEAAFSDISIGQAHTGSNGFGCVTHIVMIFVSVLNILQNL